MDVYVMVRRKKLTVFLDATEISPVFEIKKKLSFILEREVEDMKLYRNGGELEDSESMADAGCTRNTAKTFDPAQIDLSFKQEDGSFEPLDISAYSNPPPLPDVMMIPETSEIR